MVGPCLAAVLFALLGASPVFADLRDPAAWHVLVNQESIDHAVVWNGQLAGTDDAGGVILFDPVSGTIEALTTRDRLTSNRVTAVAVDEAQQLWIGTFGGGIVRMDRARVAKAVTGLLALDVTALAADGNFVFYGTQVGAGLIVGGSAGATFTTDDGLVANAITAVAAYDGTTWFGTHEGISQFSRSANRFETVNTGLDTADARDVVALLAGPQGVFAATEAGLFRYGQVDMLWTWTDAGLGAVVRSLSTLGGDVLALEDGPHAYRLPAGSAQWDVLDLDLTHRELRAIVGGPDGEIWYAGSLRDPARQAQDPRSMFWRPGREEVTLRGLFGNNCRGLAPDGQGGYWVGTFPTRGGVTHWRSDGSVVAYNYADDGSGNGWATTGIKIAILAHSNGDLWVSDWGHGVTVVRNLNDSDPSASEYVHLTPEASPLQARYVLRLAEDPQGRIWFGGSGQGNDDHLNQGIDILRNPRGDLFDPANWEKIVVGESQLAGNVVFGLAFQGINVVWLAETNVGLQRFKYDGFSESGVLSSDFFDDSRYWRTLTNDDFGLKTLSDPRDIDVASDGAIWFGANGQGVIRFRFVDVPTQPVRDLLRVQQTTFGPSLLSDQVRSIRLGADGTVWAATDAGLNRITGSDASDLRVDSWTDFFAFTTRGLPSSEVISPIPGSNMFKIDYDPRARRVFMATQTGAAALDVDRLAPPTSGELSFVVYPNPIRDTEAVYINGFDGTVDVSIYNLLGVLLATDADVESGEQVWDTRTVTGELVTSGVYLVRISRDGESSDRVLAVER